MAQLPDIGTQSLATPRPPGGVASVNLTAAGEAQMHLGSTIMDVGAQIQRQIHEFNTTLAEDYDSKLAKARIQLERGPDGFMNVKGLNVMNPAFEKNAMGSFDAAATSLMSGLNTAEQRRMAQHRASIQKTRYLENFTSYRMAQATAGQNQADTDKQAITTEIYANTMNPREADDAVASGNAALTRRLNREGIPEKLPDGTDNPSWKLAFNDLSDSRVASRLFTMSTQGVDGPSRAYAMYEAIKDTIHNPKLRLTLGDELRRKALPFSAKTAAMQSISMPAAQDLTAGVIPDDSTGTTAGDQPIGGSMQVSAQDQRVRDIKQLQLREAELALPVGDPNAPQDRAAAQRVVDTLKTSLASPIAISSTRKVGALDASAPKIQTKAGLQEWLGNEDKVTPIYFKNDPAFHEAYQSAVKNIVNTAAVASDAADKQTYQKIMGWAMGRQSDGSIGAKPTSLDPLMADPEMSNALIRMTDERRAAIDRTLTANASVGKHYDPAVVESLMKRIELPWTDTRKIYEERQLTPFLYNGIDTEKHDWLVKQIKEGTTVEGRNLSILRTKAFDAFKPQLDDSTLTLRDEYGGERNLQFQQYATAKEQEYIKAGKDPTALYIYGNSDYIGNQAKAFRTTFDERIQHKLDSITQAGAAGVPVVTDRKPGESIAAWKKRNGK